MKRGVGFWPLDYSSDYMDECFKLIKDGSDLVVAQRGVFETEQNRELHRVYDAWLDRGANAGLQKYIALEPFDGPRTALQKPEGWVGDTLLFSDSRVRRAFRMEVLKIVDRHRPAYLNLGVEANMYYVHNPNDYEHFRTLFQSVREEIKAVSPDTKVFVSFQYEVLRGAAPFLPGEPQWALLGPLAVEQDLLGISSYPEFLVSPYLPESIPLDYFQELGERLKMPIFIAEIGWYSSSSVTPGSSPTNQAWFIDRLPSLLDGLTVDAVCWVNLTDPQNLPVLAPLNATLPQLFSLGLVDDQLLPKPGWHAWKELAGGPRRP